jgi:hypothetical protein
VFTEDGVRCRGFWPFFLAFFFWGLEFSSAEAWIFDENRSCFLSGKTLVKRRAVRLGGWSTLLIFFGAVESRWSRLCSGSRH